MITFRNKGALDVRAITTFGVSSKENDNAIGFFGTGLKYAISILLRNNCGVTIKTDGRTYSFYTVNESIRVNDFNTVYMNVEDGEGNVHDERLAFTTELGKTWELWQAYREIYCNCIDEGGEVTDDAGASINDSAGSTLVAVSGGAFKRLHDVRYEEVLCPQTHKVYDDARICQIRHGESKRVYYRGIRAYELNKPAMHTYNLLAPMELSEDRSIKYQFYITQAIAAALTQCDDEELLRKVLLAPDGTLEASIDFAHCPGVADGPIFADVVRSLMRENPTRINRSAMAATKMCIADTLPEESETSVLRGVNAERLEKAVAFCTDIGFDVSRYPIIVVEHIDIGVQGLAHKGKIYVTRVAFEMGTKALAGALIEEFIHLSHKCDDMTREMQNILIDRIVTLGEELKGEPI